MTTAARVPALAAGERTNEVRRADLLLTWGGCAAIAFVGSLSFGVALVSLAKLAFFLCAALVLASQLWGMEKVWQPPLTGIAAHALVCLLLFALSVSWSDISLRQSLNGWVKYSKLLIPVLLCMMLHRLKWTKIAFLLLIFSQWCVLILTWIIILDGRPDWLPTTTSSLLRPHETSPFTTYLDQSIMNALSASMAWYCRRHFDSAWMKNMLLTFALFSATTCLYTIGRTGQLMVVIIAVITFIYITYDAEKPLHRKILMYGLPLGLGVIVSLLSLTDRFHLATQQFKLFQQNEEIETSIGERLHYWQVGLEMLRDRPLIGYGVGSWTDTYVAHTEDTLKHPRGHEISNPHQEFIHWAVQLGLVGILLIFSWFYVVWRAARNFQKDDRRGMTCLLAGIAVAFVFNSSLYDALIGDFIVGVIGLGLAFGLRGREEFAGTDTTDNRVPSNAH